MIRRPRRPTGRGQVNIRYSEVAQQIRERLTISQVVEFYGFHPDRSGYIQCPFHAGDDHGSLKVYTGDKTGWHCFGCGAGGSVIDFVMKLFNISFPQACVRLSSDFGLNLTGEERASQAELQALAEARKREAERKAAIDREYREKAAEHCYWWNIMKHFAPAPGADVLHPFYAEALRRLPALEYWLDENIGR